MKKRLRWTGCSRAGTRIGVPVPPSGAATTLVQAEKIAASVGFPVMVRAAFALGGQKSGVAKDEKEAHGEIETEHPGYLGSQDTFYVGTLKGVGRIYQQTFVDTYAKVAFAKLYDRKNALVAADMLNDKVVPFFDEHDVKLLRVLTDRGTEYCGKREDHEYQLYLGDAKFITMFLFNSWNFM